MADRFYSVVKGEHNPHQVTEGAASSGEPLEVRVNDTLYTDKMAVLNGLQAIRNYLITRETSPIA